MQIPRIYTSQTLKAGQTVSLEASPSQHIVRVLRLRLSDSLIVFNGKGGEYLARLVVRTKTSATIEVKQYVDVDRESPIFIHLFQGISRGERMDYVIQKSTELGVKTITPLFTERCNVKLTDDRLEKRLSHWKKIAIASAEQSGRCFLPTISMPVDLSSGLNCPSTVGFVGDIGAKMSFKKVWKKLYLDKTFKHEVFLLIGPEGGFSEQEIEAANAAGFHSVSFGSRILRTETAAVVAITLIQTYGGDF